MVSADHPYDQKKYAHKKTEKDQVFFARKFAKAGIAEYSTGMREKTQSSVITNSCSFPA
jgi:hypothetical protein